jgi:hypothetical protein
LLRRWAPPVIAAWLLHLGAWSIIRFVAEPSVMSLLARTLNWFIEHFTAKGWPIEQVPWPSRFTAYQMADDIVPIVIGLLIGWWVLRRKTRIARESL